MLCVFMAGDAIEGQQGSDNLERSQHWGSTGTCEFAVLAYMRDRSPLTVRGPYLVTVIRSEILSYASRVRIRLSTNCRVDA